MLGLGIVNPLLAEVRWDDLTEPEKQILQSFEGRWNELPVAQRERLQRGARRWQNMEPAEREQSRQRFQTWQQMSPAQRARIREGYAQFRALSPAEQEKIRQRYEQFQSLPPAQREALRERWEKLTPAQREAFGLPSPPGAEMSPDERQRLLDQRLEQTESGRPGQTESKQERDESPLSENGPGRRPDRGLRGGGGSPGGLRR